MGINPKILKKIQSFELASSPYVSRHTNRAYVSDIKSFLDFQTQYHGQLCDMECLKNLSIKDVRSWLMDRQNTHSLRSTVRAFSALKIFFLYLKKNKDLESSPFFSMRPPRLKKLLPKALSVEQAFDILDNIEVDAKQNWLGLRDKALFTLIYSVGLRIQEAIDLNQDIVKKNTFIVKGKGQKSRYVPLLDAAKDALLAYLNVCPHPAFDNAPLFYGAMGARLHQGVVQKTLREYKKSYLLPDHATPHALRHSCATHLIDQTDDIRTVQELLGHSSLSTTQIYTHVSQEKLLKTYQAAHPRSNKKDTPTS